MKKVYSVLLILVLSLAAHADDALDLKVANYFKTMEKSCKVGDLRSQVKLFAKEFDIHFTRDDGVVEKLKTTRLEHLRYLKSFTTKIKDYKYSQQFIDYKIQDDGSLIANIKVRQSYLENNLFVETLSDEKLLLKPVGDSFEAVKVTVVQKVLSPE